MLIFVSKFSTFIDPKNKHCGMQADRQGDVDRVEQHVHPERVAGRTELSEEPRVFAFTLPGVLNVGVVGHGDHDPAMLVGDCPKVRLGAVVAAL